MIPIWLLGLGAVVLASDSKKAGPVAGFEVSAYKINPASPVWQATPAPPGEPQPELGPIVGISRILVVDFRPSSGDYDDVNLPSTCIQVINWCTPKVTVPLGFPKNHIPADPLTVELASANGPMLVGAEITMWAHKGKYDNAWRQGDLSRFPDECMTVTYQGEAGVGKTSDVPITAIIGDATTASSRCAFQIGPNVPRLTVAREDDARRLILWLPTFQGGSVRLKVNLAYRVIK
jgi:hypothetical protein